jgi:FkbM family methyltransferase
MIVNDKHACVGRSFLTYGEFSEGEAELFRALIQPGWTVADVGANIGAHTVLFAQLVGPKGTVYAYEPQRLIYQMLCGNVALNNLNNVVCRHQAVGAEPGLVHLASLDPDVENNFGGASLDAIPGDEAVVVGPLTVPCHFLKIDVEGMEIEVLAGAADMIRRVKPRLYVENDREDRSAALIDAIYHLGYTPYWHLTPLFNPGNFRGETENIFGGQASINMLCVPQPSGVNGLKRAERGTTWQDAIHE